MLAQWHVKDPGHSAKSAGSRVHIKMHTPLTQQSWSRLTMLLSRHSVGTNVETSSHATRQGTLGHSRLSSLSHCGLILAENELSNILQNSSHARKKPPPVTILFLSSFLSSPPPHPLFFSCKGTLYGNIHFSVYAILHHLFQKVKKV